MAPPPEGARPGVSMMGPVDSNKEQRQSGMTQQPTKSTGLSRVTGKVNRRSMDDPADQAGKQHSEEVLSWLKRRNGETLQFALAFVPWVLQQAYYDGNMDADGIVIHKGQGAVVLCDASGFTTLTETLATKANGAELLSHCLRSFFTPLINFIHNYRGDVIKFSSGALTVYFQAVDDTKSSKYNKVVPPHGTYGLPDLGPMATAVLRAAACCIEIRKRLHMFDTGVDGVKFQLRTSMGCGPVSILQVGGGVPPDTQWKRSEYIIAGPPLEQISVAEPFAENGETCVSPQAWEYIKGCVIEGKKIQSKPEYHLLSRMDESKYTFPTVKHAAIENDNRSEKQFKLSELPLIRRYIPSAVYKQIECGTLEYVNEMRTISTIFISGSGLDVTDDRGANICQELVMSVQRCVYQHEGALNKFLIDDKGMTFLIVFGLPPLVHKDDPTRAVLVCFDLVKVFQRLDLVGKFGVTTGRSYCGLCGSARRMEYTVLGDCVNLANRLMNNAQRLGILCDEETKNRSSTEVIFNALHPVKVRGRSAPVPVFQPVKKDALLQIGLTPKRNVRFPWHDAPFGGAATSTRGTNPYQRNVRDLCSVKSWEGISKVQQWLGGGFLKNLHTGNPTVNMTTQAHKPPEGPLKEGGVIVLEGATGMGKIELCEHMVMHVAVQFHMLPVFGTMGPRPGDSTRLAGELLRSALGVYRALAGNNSNEAELMMEDDFEALAKVAPPQFRDKLPRIKEALNDSAAARNPRQTLKEALDLIISLMKDLVKKSPILLCLQFEYGTSLFPKALQDRDIFWESVTQLYNGLKDSFKDSNALSMVILCQNCELSNLAVTSANASGTLLTLRGLTEEDMLQYMSNYLVVPDTMVPQPLRQFVFKVTSGNPYYTRETIDQLMEKHIQVNLGANNKIRSLECKDIDSINISSWHHTAMVSGTVCLLESLDPLPAVVLKMSTCFRGQFTLPDLAASISPRWAGATHFDFLRLFKAIQILVEQGILDQPEDAEVEATRPGVSVKGGIFQMRNLLIRAVGTSMVLESQRKSVKRQALIDRVLCKELPGRMEVLASKRNATHIPWYYEQAFRRM